MKLTTVAAYLLCLTGGAFLGRFDLHTDDTGVEVFFLIVITFLLGFLHPRRAWQWSLLVPLWIPAAEVFFGRARPPLTWSTLLLACFVCLVGLGGSYAGVAFRRMISAAGQPG
jgi:hypothetical protein